MKETVAKKLKLLKKELHKIPSGKLMDSKFRRIHYVRYADDFIIGLIGTKEDALKVKHDLTIFLKNKLKLELSQEKTLITNSRNFARFLGYDIVITRIEFLNTRLQNGKKVAYKHTLQVALYVPNEKWVNKLLSLGALEIKKDNSWKTKHRPNLGNLDDLEILSIYNAELRGLYNYYKLANNVSVLHKFHFIMKYSMLKTFANKYRTKSSKIWSKYSVNGNFGVKYKTKSGEKICYFNESKYIRDMNIKRGNPDIFENTLKYSARTSLIQRLTAGKCERCGKDDSPIEIHHVRKLKDLKGKKMWEKWMIERNRKTLALCIVCHKDLHAGRLD
jgi:hypothetical protein